jgi:hypothetical protein
VGLARAVDPGWTAAQTAVVIVAVIALVGGIITASVAYGLNQRAASRERRAEAFAKALAAVEDYAEMPYRVRRRRDNPEARYALTEEVSKIQSQLAFHQALLQIESPDVGSAYNTLVRAAKIQAGTQMKEAWQQPALTTDAAMNLGVRYPRDEIDAARATCITAMRRALGNRDNAAVPPTANSDPPPLSRHGDE